MTGTHELPRDRWEWLDQKHGREIADVRCENGNLLMYTEFCFRWCHTYLQFDIIEDIIEVRHSLSNFS